MYVFQASFFSFFFFMPSKNNIVKYTYLLSTASFLSYLYFHFKTPKTFLDTSLERPYGMNRRNINPLPRGLMQKRKSKEYEPIEQPLHLQFNPINFRYFPHTKEYTTTVLELANLCTQYPRCRSHE